MFLPLVLLMVSATGAEKRFVSASVANLRAQPVAGAEIVQKIPIAFPVEVLETTKGWSRVRVKKKVGWISAALLSERQPSLSLMLDRFDAAKTGEARRAWAERAAALAPHDIRALARLLQALKEAGDERALAQALAAIETRFRVQDSLPAPTVDAAAEATRVWLGLERSPHGCRDVHHYFPRGGMRELFCHVQALMPYARILELAPVPLEVEAVAESLELSSKESFIHYNPDFVQWMIDRAIPGARDPKLLVRLQPIYDAYLRELARIYLEAIYKMRAEPGFIERETAAYRAYVARPEGVPFHRRFEDLVPSSNRGTHAVAFWIRRAIDGSAPKFLAGIEKLTLLYDPMFLIEIMDEYAPRTQLEDVQLALPGEYHGGEMTLVEDQSVLGLYRTKDGFELRPVAFSVEAVRDPLLDAEDQKTGTRLEVKESDGLAILLAGGFSKGPVISMGDPTACDGACELRLGERTYRIESSFREVEVEPGDRRKSFSLQLSYGERAQRLEGIGSVLFFGDLDRDGALDLLIEDRFHYNTIESVKLYLSSGAPPGRLVRLAGSFRAVGC